MNVQGYSNQKLLDKSNNLNFFFENQVADHEIEKRSLAFPRIDLATVYPGIFDPSNIAIHVGQNFVNFAAGTFFW